MNKNCFLFVLLSTNEKNCFVKEKGKKESLSPVPPAFCAKKHTE
jgi:hypothetical protein